MFLVENKIKERIKDIAKQGHSIDCAVAFWGIGAENLFPADTKVRIICDLLSGGTNPFAIKILMDKGCEVKHLKNLHAKVYIGKNAALVTSANASTNGLGLENEEAKTIEAGYEVSDAQEVAKIQAWFNNKWNEAIEINEQDMEKARIAFSRNKRANNTIKIPENESIIHSMLENTEKYANLGIYVFIYNELHSERTQEKIDKQIEIEKENPVNEKKEYRAYDVFVQLPRGVDYLDIYIDEGGEATMDLIRMPRDVTIKRNELTQSNLYYGHEIKTLLGRKLDGYQNESKLWGKAAALFFKSESASEVPCVELGEFIEKYLKEAIKV